ncbi:hypothetical protein TRAPUB_6917 [Trametes pubescens]|uniref:C2H2-type domain-containing protein n=1 Tax=Trametes pubescens TaxID=154538 RepID=A0A1M2V4J5_TRAPU|nr:hypothetical protein TRAPUB_6917 [Trametes pubescens]
MEYNPFALAPFVNIDLFEEDGLEEYLAAAMGLETASEEYSGSDDLQCPGTDSLSSFDQAIQRTLGLRLQPGAHYALFYDASSAPWYNNVSRASLRAVAERGAVLADDTSNREEEEELNKAGSGDDAEDEGCEPSESMNGNSHVLQSASSSASLPRVSRVQEASQSSASGEASPRNGSNKENVDAIMASPVAVVNDCESPRGYQLSPPRVKVHRLPRNHQEQPVAGPSSVTLDTQPGVIRRSRTRSQKTQPVPGPSSIPTEDLDTPEPSSGSEEEEQAPTKRPRSTPDEVKAVQTAARKASVCGLDGGRCRHSLTNDPKVNKQHIKIAHPSRIPRSAGTTSSTTGPLKLRKKVLSNAQVRQEVAKGSLACTWAARPGGARCGAVCSGATAQANLEKHVENSHWGREFGCDMCEFTCNTLFSLDRHKGTHVKSEGENEDAEEADELGESPKKRRRTK